MKTNKRTLYVCQAAVIAAAYVVLTLVARVFGLDSLFIQLRLSEALCILPVFCSAAIPGLTVGCLLANLLARAVWLDMLVGPIATLIGALGTYALRKHFALSLLPPILSNTLIIPFVLCYGYEMTEAIPVLMLGVGAGEVLSVGVLGTVFYLSVKKHAARIFKA